MIKLPKDEIADFCHRWKITELSLFGSVLRDDFGPDSDIDILVTFAPEASWSLLEQDELKMIFGRDVDLLSRRGLEHSRNYLRRKAILDSVEVIHPE